jgi:hypothetical protein
MQHLSRTALAVIIAISVLLPISVWRGAMTSDGTDREPTVYVGKPVRLTPIIVKADDAEASKADRTFLHMTMTAYQPPQSGRVEIVIRAIPKGGAPPRDISRFSVFPNQRFKARKNEEIRAQLLAVRECAPSEAQACIGDVEVSLQPVQGTGEGANLTVGVVEIMFR